MQAAAAPLPKFHGLRGNAVSSPVGRHRHFGAGVFFFQGLHAVFQHGATVDDGTLLRHPCAELVGARPRVEIGFAFLDGKANDRAFDDDLPFKRHPLEQQGNAGVFGKIAALAAVVVGVKNETASVEAFEQNGARRRPALARGGGERHGIGLGDFGGLGFLEPFFELAEWITRQVFFEESSEVVVFAKIGEGHGVCRRVFLGRPYVKNHRVNLLILRFAPTV